MFFRFLNIYINIMEIDQSESVSQKEFVLPPPPPPLLSLNLPPPTLTEHAYSLHYEKKHIAMINGSVEYGSLKEEVDTKLKQKFQKNEKSSHQNESTGEKQLRNLQICQKCEKCGHWVQNSQMKVHLTFHANKIIDNLLLGDKNSSKSKKELFQRNSVTHVVNAALELDNCFQNEGIKYLKLILEDQPGQYVISQAQRAADFINQSITEGGCVFVHCALGKSRSVSAIMMYLMKYLKMNYDESLSLIRKARPIAKPNLSYEEQLREYARKELTQ